MTKSNALTVDQPFDGRELATLDVDEWPEVDAMLGRARAAFRDRSRRLPGVAAHRNPPPPG